MDKDDLLFDPEDAGEDEAQSGPLEDTTDAEVIERPDLSELFDLSEDADQQSLQSSSRNTAVVFMGSGRSRLSVRPVPEIDSGEILLRMRVCGLCGTDLFKLASDTAEPGSVLGHELIGEVEAVGANVSQLAVGERVVVPHHVACHRCELCRRGAETKCAQFQENLMEPGGFAELIRIHRRAVRLAAQPVPEHISDRAMVFMEPAACVLRGVRAAQLPSPPACAVVIGAGSMGLLHLLVLHAESPELTVGVVEPMPERRALAESLGADWTSAPDVESMQAATMHVTQGLGADAVFDTVGGPAVLSASLAVTRPGGTVVLFAHAAAQESAGFELNPFFKAEQRVVGTYSGGLAEQRRVWELIASCRLDPSPLVTHELPLSRFEEAVRLCRDRRALKVLLTPDRDSGGTTA